MPRLFDRTEQQMFDEVIEHARKQNNRSVDPKTLLCKYRSSDGSKCFIGALISDEDYCPEMEGWGNIPDLCRKFPNNVGAPSENQSKLAIALQRVHDQTFIADSDWESQFKEIAEKFNLIYTPPQRIQNEVV